MVKWKKGKMINNDQQNITHKAKHRVLRTPVKTEVELRWSRRVGSLCSTSDICRVTLVTNPMISHEWGKNRKVEHICGHLWHRYFVTVKRVMVVTVNLPTERYLLYMQKLLECCYI
jgi:hypothetical protein